MEPIDICRRLVFQHMLVNPAHGGPGHLDMIELRRLIYDARALFRSEEIERMELDADECNEDGLYNTTPRVVTRPPAPRRTPRSRAA